MKYEAFAEMINMMNFIKIEMDRFNDSMDSLLGSDTRSMYLTPLEIIDNFVIQILQNEFNETKEGAEWFVYEGLEQIKNGGTELTDDGKNYKISSIKDYYQYLTSLKI